MSGLITLTGRMLHDLVILVRRDGSNQGENCVWCMLLNSRWWWWLWWWWWELAAPGCVCVCAPSPRTLMFKSRADWGVTVPLRRSHDRDGELDGGSRKSVCQEEEEEEEEPEHINNTQRKETNVKQKVSLFYRHGRHQRYVKYRCCESLDSFAR